MDPLQARSNYSKVCQLLINKGGDALRNVLQTEIRTSPPPSTLDSLLNTHKKSLQKIRYSVINAAQWKLLFPASGSADSNNFDITLLTVLLRNICALPSPAAGWNLMPPASDTSISANILRIKMFRNEVYGHISSAQLDDTKFETLWQEISQPLIKLGIPQKDIDELKEAPLSPEEESYIAKLKKWKESEDELISKLNDVEEEVVFMRENVVDLRAEVIKLRTVVESVKSPETDKLAKFVFKGKIDQLIRKFQEGTRKWFFDDFEKWLHDTKSRVMILNGGPGVGKSVLSAKLCVLYEETGQLAGCHFCDFKTPDYRDPHRILQSLTNQMCDNVHGFRDKLTEVLSREHSRDSLSGAFRVLLNDPLHALDRTEPMLIVVDALDESKTSTKSEFLDLISDEFSQLPKWMKIFISTRPELKVREKLEHLNPVEIKTHHGQHNRDLEHFIQLHLPNISERNMKSLILECQGSFLYAYYLVIQVKQVYSENNPNINVDVPKGISGFYEKQFERLKKDLQCYEQRMKVRIVRNFVNVVAASEKPLPFRFLFLCMDLFSEQFEVRKTIVGIMSEILPVYDDCLTVFHKSLWDWLRLDGYEEHAYAADVADGKKRLWDACKKVYTDIDSLRSVSDLKISQEKTFALENGWDYLLSVDDMEDLHWLVNIMVNYVKFLHLEEAKRHMYTKATDIFKKIEYGTPLYWHLFQLYTFLAISGKRFHYYKHENFMYLQYFGNKRFGLVDNIGICEDAREILKQANMIWLEEVTGGADSSFKIITCNFAERYSKYDVISSSPDNRLLAFGSVDEIIVYNLPSLTILFMLKMGVRFIVFSPDSSYFLLNSLQTCISIKSESKVSFIQHGPTDILYCAFSSCGMKLVSLEEDSIKLWDVKKKEILAETKHSLHLELSVNIWFSSSGLYIFVFNDCCVLSVWDSTTLSEVRTQTPRNTEIRNCTQFISPPFNSNRDFHLSLRWSYRNLPTGEKIEYANKPCSKSFVWKGRKCVMTLSGGVALVVYDYINQQVVDTFHLSCLPTYVSTDYILNLGGNNFLICLDRRFVFVLSLESFSEFTPFPLLNTIGFPKACAAISPDTSYVFYTYNNSPILKIMDVDNGKILQTIELKQTPLACWWSKLCLWVFCDGLVVVKYPYNPTETQIVGNCIQECSINVLHDVHWAQLLDFANDVLLLIINDEISMLKVHENNLRALEILDSKLKNPRVSISSDGCAVLLYELCWTCEYEWWEMGSEDKWELHSTGKLNPSTAYGCLTGKQNSRSFLWLLNPVNKLSQSSDPSVTDFSIANPGAVHQLPVQIIDRNGVIYVGSKLLICRTLHEVIFIRTSDGEIITSIYVGSVIDFFFVPSKRKLLLFYQDGVMKHFKIHNIDTYLRNDESLV